MSLPRRVGLCDVVYIIKLYSNGTYWPPPRRVVVAAACRFGRRRLNSSKSIYLYIHFGGVRFVYFRLVVAADAAPRRAVAGHLLNHLFQLVHTFFRIKFQSTSHKNVHFPLYRVRIRRFYINIEMFIISRYKKKVLIKIF